MNRAIAIGIDFGSSKSCLAVMENEDISIIPNDLGKEQRLHAFHFQKKKDFLETLQINK